MPIGIVVGVLAGGLIGLINGTLIARVGLPPFIATLGMLNVARGLALVLSDVRPVYFPNNPEFNRDLHGLHRRFADPGFDLPLPNLVLVFFGVAIVAGFILSQDGARSLHLRHRQQRGSHPPLRCARDALQGLGLRAQRPLRGPRRRGLAARLNSAQPAEGFGYELDAIAAAVIGGTSLSGGEGSIFGTVIGAFIISVLTNGLRLLSVPQEWQITITGIIVILAVYLDILRRRHRG